MKVTPVTELAPAIVKTIWVTDAELIRRSGVPERIMRANLRELDHNPNSGFPRKDKLWGGRRHWPSVEAYFARLAAPEKRRA